MKCPKCGNELEEGKLLCENCGYEVNIVPDFDIELEDQLKESISVMLQDMMSGEELTGSTLDREDEDFPDKPIRPHKIRKIIIVLAVLVVVAGMAAIAAVHMVEDYRYNSFDYQYDKAVVYAAHDAYSEAVSYLERALAIRPEDLDVKFLLAKYYEQDGKQQNTISLLEEILDIDKNYTKRAEVYDMLLGIYESKEDYMKINEIVEDCDVLQIVSKYSKYTASKPEFNKEGGEYDELISISLRGNMQGVVYYTLDGTEPTQHSSIYETPILLESGEYTIKAMFVNMYGVESETVTQQYVINVSAPDSPVINLDSGTYTEPFLIEVYYDHSTRVYYTTDGSVPDKNSLRYTEPIEMPYGVSNFSFIAIDESGLDSVVVNRTYHLEIKANFNEELALQVLKNSLWASGKLLSVEGNVPNRLGINQYKVRTLFKSDETMYYIVYEEYVDTMGKIHETNNIYAVDANTAKLYRAYKIDEGKYDLQSFLETLE